MLNGLINVYKEKGYTSFDVVAKLRGILKMRKIGHTGTLDPEAEGVLVVCLGRATKVCGLLTDKDKEYEAVMLLGTVTDTQDATGTVLKTQEVRVSEEAVREAVFRFRGEYMQVPPMYSALKVNGRKLCDLARAGVTVERKARPVNILNIEISDIALPRVRMRVECSKGTYIRTLCHDIGEKLGCGACMESLRRTQVSCFSEKDAYRLSEIEALVKEEAKGILPGDWENGMFSFLRSVDSVFDGYEKAVVKQEYEKTLCNGGRLSKKMFLEAGGWTAENVRVYDEEGNFIGIYRYSGERDDYRPAAMFIER